MYEINLLSIALKLYRSSETMDANQIILIIRAMLRGCIDNFKGAVSSFYIDGMINQKAATISSRRVDPRKRKPAPVTMDGKVWKKIIKCCSLNGCVFWASILIFEHIGLPCYTYIMHWLSVDYFNSAFLIWSKSALVVCFSTLWIMPMFIISKIVNTLWCQDIADSAFWCTQGKPSYIPNVSKFLADIVFSLLIQTLFLIQATIVSLFPITYVGEIFYIIHMCLLYSLYAFEYKWCKLGWELHKRLLYIEKNWPYFIGFGLPLAVLTALPESYFVSCCVFAIIFPFSIISANEAVPATNSCNFQLHLFSLVISLSNTITNKTVKGTASILKKKIHKSR